MPPEDNEAIPEYAAPTKMQRAQCATYPLPLPSPASYTSKAWEDFVDNFESEVCQPEPLTAMTKWYDSYKDSNSSNAPRIKNILARGPQQSNQRENSSKFLKMTQKV